MLRLWLIVILACASAFAPSRAGARAAETRAQDFFAAATNLRPESAPQVADSHQGNLACGYELASGCPQAAESPMARGVASEARVLQDMGLAKNTAGVTTAEGRAIPDALTKTLSVEVKDTASVSLTRQLRIQTGAAADAGRQSVLVTGQNTTVSGPAKEAFDQIIRRSDLGPQ